MIFFENSSQFCINIIVVGTYLNCLNEIILMIITMHVHVYTMLHRIIKFHGRPVTAAGACQIYK